ncbi:bifunctional riboflavin kinase/FAD synthetase [Halanaerocella petrolearia]
MDDILSNQVLDSEVVITLGTFDGVHMAHQKIINLAVERAKELSCKSVLFTFSPHPLSIVAPEKAPAKLTSWQQKKREIKKSGIDQIVRQRFTSEFAQLNYQDFIAELSKQCTIKEVIVGQDFSCGYQGVGTPEKLADLGKKFGFKLQTVPSVKLNNAEIGSTYIRQAIKAGQLDKAKKQLGRNFTLDCKVVKGDQRGRKLGFPTANLKPVTDYVLPPCGVYACRVIYDKEIYFGVVSLGMRPTFNKDKLAIEAHLFDFSQNIYGARLELEFIDWIRGEEEYNSSQELIAQIEQDIIEAKKILNFS